jgi:hypothetical protein
MPSRFIHPRSDCEGHGCPRRRDNLHERFEVKTINHQEAYSLDGACANMAEEYCSRLRRAEIDAHRPVAGRLSPPPRGLAILRNNPVVVTVTGSNFMSTEIRVPTIADAGPKLSIGRWFKRAGDPVTSGEPLVEIDTDNYWARSMARFLAPGPPLGTLAAQGAIDARPANPQALGDG